MSHQPLEGSYSAIADQQLDRLQHDDPALYNDVLIVCELILSDPARAQSMSAAIHTDHRVVFRLAVPGRFPHKVFWDSSGPRIEAVFPYA